MCGQEMTEENSNLHHLVPVLKGGRKGETVRLHKICHEKIHSIWSENELRDVYNTMNRITADERIQKFIKWVRKQKNLNQINKLSNDRKYWKFF